eukprot:GHRR01003376.1.p3 GENE.GHRR01003376.1~~GHRR01003376.1.p3  ORF type:complete len:129 (+),score=35.14 GHRR01003376.1:221-607(+)
MAPRKGTMAHNKGKRKATSQQPEPQPQPNQPAAQAMQSAQPEAAQEPSISALQQLEEKRARLTSQLQEVERQIYDLETRYLEGCNPHANALRGYESLRSQLGSSKPTKPQPVATEDRVFSASSTTAAQ